MPQIVKGYLYDTGKVGLLPASDSEVIHFQEEQTAPKPRLLWVVELYPSVGENHGAGMRFLNFARELSSAGTRVYFAANVFAGDDRNALEEFLRKLERDGTIAGSLITDYRYTARQGRKGALVLYPGLTNWVLRDVQREPLELLFAFVKEHDVTAALVSDRRLLFMGDGLRSVVPTIFDWTDSMALHYWRALKARLRSRETKGLFGFLRDYQANVIAEFYYGRRADLNTAVSPVDKLWLDRTNFRKSRNRLWMNGTKTEDMLPQQKIPKRLIFSGAMDYLPNYEGALWFIDEVFPSILKKHPDAQFVVAGVNPLPQLLARASKQVLIKGFVDDLGSEIAQSSLYVAPLLSGGGFRNKVVESIMKGTYLVGTPMSVEFLPDRFRQVLTVVSNAAEMTEAVVRHLDNPAACQEKLDGLREMVKRDFSWRGRSGELLQLLAEADRLHSSQHA